MITVPGAIAIPVAPLNPDSSPVQVEVGPNPAQAALTPDGAQIWVTDASSNQVYIINTSSLLVTRTIGLPTTPYGIAFSPNGSDAWVSGRNPNVAVELSTSTESVISTVSVPVLDAYPYMIAVSPNGTQVWMSEYYHNVTIINARTATIMSELLVLPQGDTGGVTAMSFSPDGRAVYFGFTGLPISSNVVVAYNATTRTMLWSSTIDCAGSVGGIIESPDEGNVYVLNDSTPGAEFNVLGAKEGSIVARIPLPTIRVEDFSTMAVTDGGYAVWFAGSEPGNDAVLVGVNSTADSIGVIDYDPDVNGSTSLSLAQNRGTAYALADGGSPYLLAWSDLPNLAAVRCLPVGTLSRGCVLPNTESYGSPAAITIGPQDDNVSSEGSASCLTAPIGEDLLIDAIVVVAVTIMAVVVVTQRRATTPPSA